MHFYLNFFAKNLPLFYAIFLIFILNFQDGNKSGGKLSEVDLRYEGWMDDSWHKVQERLIDARLHDREVSRDIERVCELSCLTL